ncbi:uncharacterized protein BJ212DRAFT_458550 [Suillus subaureus]|uniref:Uncharacterized protein n=1 Tax=Suillus subaureus TaxID=48587 RepID=A0A9P7JB16_9AGAM|nr:uncharacterized protein BJ212DRAFT_458550 [Suillus subaureus]KAG1812586.1 hypothetical protein BJ212DRAFT_458550 [Suillus subaureus]
MVNELDDHYFWYVARRRGAVWSCLEFVHMRLYTNNLALLIMIDLGAYASICAIDLIAIAGSGLIMFTMVSGLAILITFICVVAIAILRDRSR